jgi:hypothetical protein
MKDDDSMIIGLTGYKGVGKDTVAAYLMKEHSFERKAFADPLKQSVAALFGIQYSSIDQYKNMDGMRVWMGHRVISRDNQEGMSFREFLQRYGTESHRDVFGENFWVDLTLPVGGYYPGRAIVVTDVRFSNEAARIRDLGGTVVRIIRGNAAPFDQDHHRSEVQDFDWDYILENNGTLRQLYDNVEELLSCVIDRISA